MILRLLSMLVLASLLGGCLVRGTEVVRVREPATPIAAPATGAEHSVARGETLYSIAFRNQLDWRDLAAWNGLAAPYTIYPGQRLRLSSATRPGTSSQAEPVIAAHPQPAPVAPPPTNIPAAAPPLAGAPPPATPPAPVATQPVQPPPASPAQPVPPPSTPPPATPPAAQPAPTAGAPPARDIEPAPTASVAGIQWRWPTQGEVIQRYRADAARQGIDIAGRSGQAVVAAADGEVVYSGAGLRGYGELVIIKHSAEFLSAYGHNRKRLVNEGERVRAGQPIAEMGRTATDRDKLHFEIRRGGRPVDPMQFLPRR